MTVTAISNPAVWSFGLGLAGFALFGLRLAIGRKGGWKGGWRVTLLLAAVAASALWEGASVGYSLAPSESWWLAARLADAARLGAWIAFLLALFAQPGALKGAAALGKGAAPLWIGALAAVLILASLVARQPAPMAILAELPSTAARIDFALLLAIPILGLLVIEQLLRGTPKEQRWHMKPLYLGLGGAFAFDVFLYADALLFGRLDPAVWAARGVVTAFAIPFVAVAAARSHDWSLNMHVSRDVVFHSTALLLSGVYLLAVAAAGYWVRFFGGTWGTTVQIAFLFAAALLLGLVLSSGSLRARLRVFISKHFFSYRYNYREEWLKFTGLLSGAETEASLSERCVRALADLVESTAGALFLKQDGAAYVEAARWNTPEVATTEPVDSAFVQFLQRTGWVLNLAEHREGRAEYEGIDMPEWLGRIPRAWLVVPLFTGGELVGFVVLAAPRTSIDVNWEVNDLLKTAARQAASYIGQVRAAEALLEAQKFASFNRMSAFVVHDLKNLVAQLSLLLRNAERHRDNPEFHQDMLDTVEHVVGRMNQLLLQLRAGTTPVEAPRPVSLSTLVERIGKARASQRPELVMEAALPIQALGHEDRLERVIGHLVQNALEATPPDGQVTLRVFEEGEYAVVEVADTGTGMSTEFVRERLFKPFQSTKPTGMGIGAYESSQYVGELGGRILVDSRPNAGTRVKVYLPRVTARRDGPQTEAGLPSAKHEEDLQRRSIA
jgi:putative PEP-CTERM system histidine kinase